MRLKPFSGQGLNYSRITYFNDGKIGKFIPHPLAKTHIDDRGLQFSDGIYEVLMVENRRLIDEESHYKRLARSLKAIQISAPATEKSIHVIIMELLRRNALKDAMVYIQITRGIAKRDHYFPKNSHSTLLITVAPLKKPSAAEIENGVAVTTMPDLRWQRRDIKSLSLLPNVLAKNQALPTKEAWLIDNGTITEGCSTNAYIVTAAGTLRTHPKNHLILGGVTRESVLELAKKNKIKVEEKPFTLQEALNAKEAFFTNTTARILPVVKIDGKKIGDGKPGKTTRKLMKIYNDYVDKITKT
jgi:D-alanine transaminase